MLRKRKGNQSEHRPGEGQRKTETNRDERSSCYVQGNQEGISPASALGDTPRGKPQTTTSIPASTSKHVFQTFLPSLIFSLTFCISLSLCSSKLFKDYSTRHSKCASETELAGPTCSIPLRVRERCTTDNRRTFHSPRLPCNICKKLLFPTTPPPSRTLHPRKMHASRCKRKHTRSHSILLLCSGLQIE